MMRTVFFLLMISLLGACAGPNDPFGSMENFEKVSSTEMPERASASTNSVARINFLPSRRLSHRSNDFKIVIHDPKGIGRNYKMKVRFEDHYVEDRWLEKAKKKLSEDGKTLEIDFGKLRFLPDRDNLIIVSYQRDRDSGIAARQYMAPECSLTDIASVRNFDGFEDKRDIFEKIEKIALERGVNPAFISALVAQESSFNPEAVSWAKAVGLTQVTSVASKQIETDTGDWPRHRGIASMSVPTLKWYISRDKINEKNEWRLDKDLSIEGGIHFLGYLDEYWNLSENEQLLVDSFGKHTPWSDILLASYNSGAFNVKKTIRYNGRDWLKSRRLKEARKYVNKIKSYCYAFSNQEVFL